jgi:hypothetical protein
MFLSLEQWDCGVENAYHTVFTRKFTSKTCGGPSTEESIHRGNCKFFIEFYVVS